MVSIVGHRRELPSLWYPGFETARERPRSDIDLHFDLIWSFLFFSLEHLFFAIAAGAAFLLVGFLGSLPSEKFHLRDRMLRILLLIPVQLVVATFLYLVFIEPRVAPAFVVYSAVFSV